MALWHFAWLIFIYERKVKKNHHENTKEITMGNTIIFRALRRLP
jgi:hypothetical protein